MFNKWNRLLLALLALHCAGLPKVSAQLQDDPARQIADQAGIALEPVPHLRDTSVLVLPSGLSRPEAMTSPKEGSIYVEQLQEENDYWQKATDATPALREKKWTPDFSSISAYRTSLQEHRLNLRQMLGLTEANPEKPVAQSVVLNAGPIRIEDLTITIAKGFQARALLFVPAGKVSGAVIAIPDANTSREEFVGLKEGNQPAPWLNVLLSKGLAVTVPVTVQRTTDYPFGERWGVDRRQLLYRLGFIVGRTLVGMEVQQVLALRDYIETRFNVEKEQVGLLGLGQGGMTAFYAAAVDGQFGAVSVVDYFQQRENSWQEPVDRMLYGQLKMFGDAEVAALIAPKPLEVVSIAGGAISQASVEAEAQRALRFYQGLNTIKNFRVRQAASAEASLHSTAEELADVLGQRGKKGNGSLPPILKRFSEAEITRSRNEQFDGLHAYLKELDQESDEIRTRRWDLLKTSAVDSNAKAAELRSALGKLMGEIALNNDRLDPHTRLLLVTDKFVAYDVLLEVLPGVHAYGQLLVPRRGPGRLPVVICQHGLGGRPTDITGIGVGPEQNTYHSLGMHLANLGYVVFAPYLTVPIRQEILVNPLVRKAAALGMMRTSLELAKLHRIVDFLQTLPFIDGERIGYYGLSYGGYSATWMPPLEPRIKLNVISGHFNDWRTKITDEESSASYLRYQDADFYNWNVLNQFTHVELIAAMAPRPVCVEFGERDQTTTPEWHGRAWQQVEAWKKAAGFDGLEEKVVEAHYEGIHEIHGIGTVAFLNRWLRPDLPDGRDHSYNLLPENVELQSFSGGGDLATGQGAELPLAMHELDAQASTRIRGRFYVSPGSPILTKFSLKLSRIGHPGDLIVRLGSTPGGNDLGEAHISPNQVDPLFDLWYTAKVHPIKLDPAKLYYFEVTASSGQVPDNNYLVYGPEPFGGHDEPGYFGLSYQIRGLEEPASAFDHYQRFGFMHAMLASYGGGPAMDLANPGPRKANEVAVETGWSIHLQNGSDEVLETAGDDLSLFFKNVLNLSLMVSPGNSRREIDLHVAPAVEGVNTSEGYRITVSLRKITIEGTTSRGVMRGVYALEDAMRTRRAPYIERTFFAQNMRFGPRITTAVHPGQSLYRETSFALPYTDGLLQRISHSGFNAIWVWLNTEEATLNSSIFPELDDAQAAARLARLEDLARRARRYGIDVYIYLATGYNHHIPASFFQRHPDALGYGWGNPLCTSNEEVRRYYAETVATIFRQAPEVKGMEVIYDSEGFWYCGNSERTRQQCPRCRRFSQQQIAAQLLTTLDQAMHKAGGPEKQLIAWNYNVKSQWILKLIPLLPRDIIIQGDFDKGMIAEKEGIRNETEDYNISNVGPPALFVDEYRVAHKLGFQVMAKTEHAVSQEFIFVPYIPSLGQQYARIEKMRDFHLKGWFGNWNHYGYTPSSPAALINLMSFDPAPREDKLLQTLAERNYGPQAAPYVVKAWEDYSRGIREYPYSDPVARIPGPVQKGPSQPLFLNPEIKSFGPWRSWQNNLDWTKPWGVSMTAKYLGRLEQLYSQGNAELKTAGELAPASYRPGIDAEWRVGRTIQSSVETVLHLIDWIQMRNEFYAATSVSQRQSLAKQLETIALAERNNAQGIVPLLESDSRLGYAAVGDGGLFTPALVNWKIGQIDDVLLRQLPEEKNRLDADEKTRRSISSLKIGVPKN
jgi:cephalosporin-C deacetylase-like acetyl esterase